MLSLILTVEFLPVIAKEKLRLSEISRFQKLILGKETERRWRVRVSRVSLVAFHFQKGKSQFLPVAGDPRREWRSMQKAHIGTGRGGGWHRAQGGGWKSIGFYSIADNSCYHVTHLVPFIGNNLLLSSFTVIWFTHEHHLVGLYGWLLLEL